MVRASFLDGCYHRARSCDAKLTPTSVRESEWSIQERNLQNRHLFRLSAKVLIILKKIILKQIGKGAESVKSNVVADTCFDNMSAGPVYPGNWAS